MPQGKFKVKNKAPVDSKKPRKVSTARKNCPIAPKKWKYVEGERIKKQITKNINRRIDTEVRAIANDAPKVYYTKKKKQVQKVVEPKADSKS